MSELEIVVQDRLPGSSKTEYLDSIFSCLPNEERVYIDNEILRKFRLMYSNAKGNVAFEPEVQKALGENFFWLDCPEVASAQSGLDPQLERDLRYKYYACAVSVLSNILPETESVGMSPREKTQFDYLNELEQTQQLFVDVLERPELTSFFECNPDLGYLVFRFVETLSFRELAIEAGIEISRDNLGDYNKEMKSLLRGGRGSGVRLFTDKLILGLWVNDRLPGALTPSFTDRSIVRSLQLLLTKREYSEDYVDRKLKRAVNGLDLLLNIDNLNIENFHYNKNNHESHLILKHFIEKYINADNISDLVNAMQKEIGVDNNFLFSSFTSLIDFISATISVRSRSVKWEQIRMAMSNQLTNQIEVLSNIISTIQNS